MELDVLVADVADPVEVAEDAVGEGMAPGAEQHRADHLQGDVGQDRAGEGDRHVQAHAELARDLDHAQVPRDEGADGAEGDPLPQPAFAQRGEAEAVAQVGRCDADAPDVPGRADGGAVEDQQGADHGEEDRGDAEEADVERAHPEVEQVAADQGAAAHAVLVLEVQHRHGRCLPASGGRRAPAPYAWALGAAPRGLFLRASSAPRAAASSAPPASRAGGRGWRRRAS